MEQFSEIEILETLIYGVVFWNKDSSNTNLWIGQAKETRNIAHPSEIEIQKY
jgi:hypothetical protein